eukprot:32661-Amorphochlora_amoeboformis.AAC.1
MAAKVEKENLSEIAKRDKIIEIEHRAKADLEADLYRLRTKLQRALKAEERVGESKEDALESKYRSLSELVERLRRSKTDLEAKLSASKALEAQAIEAQKQTDKLKFDYLQLRQQLADKKHEAELASKAMQDAITDSRKREEQLVQDLQRELKYKLQMALSQGDDKVPKLTEERLDEALSQVTKKMAREKAALESKLQASLKSFEIRSAQFEKERNNLQIEMSHLKAQLMDQKRQTDRAKE